MADEKQYFTDKEEAEEALQEHQPRSWFCPLINWCCNHECWCYVKESLRYEPAREHSNPPIPERCYITPSFCDNHMFDNEGCRA